MQSDSHLCFPRYAVVDEPIIIEFENGERLEVLFNQFSQVRLSVNTLPINIEPENNCKTFDANVLFSSLIGKRFKHFHTNMTNDNKNLDATTELEEQGSYINSVTLVFDDGSGLKFSGYCGFGEVINVDGGFHLRRI